MIAVLVLIVGVVLKIKQDGYNIVNPDIKDVIEKYKDLEGMELPYGMHYTLRKGKAIPCYNYLEHLKFKADIRNWLLKRDQFFIRGYRILVSTVFLGINHSCNNENPECWETMILTPVEMLDYKCWRYNNQKDAIHNHRFIVSILENYKDCYDRKRFEELVNEFN